MQLPLLIEPAELLEHLSDPHLVLVDVSHALVYKEAHIPGARHLDIGKILAGTHPCPGTIPDFDQLHRALESLGIESHHHVVAFDDEGGGWAARFLWTLHLCGHTAYSYLNGGLVAWLSEGYPLSSETPVIRASRWPETSHPEVLADAEYILSRLGHPDTLLWDARSLEEYTGQLQFGPRAGHIPGAIHLDWTELLDPIRHMRLRPLAELHDRVNKAGIRTNSEVICYCQAHHRSALAWLAGRIMGISDIKAYPGAWAEWSMLRHVPTVRLSNPL